MKTEFEIIKDLTGVSETACSCNVCESMCKRAVCIGTPSDIERLKEAGYADKIANSLYLGGLQYDIGPIEMEQLIWDYEKGQCCMLDDNNRCRLHESGLKPTEGKLAHHSLTSVGEYCIPPVPLILAVWCKESLEEIAKTVAELRANA